MKIGVIGISSITLNLAYKAAKSGHTVLINNPRGNNLIKESIKNTGINVKLVSLQKAALTDLLILFTPFQDIENLVAILPNMHGKIILHTNNALCFRTLVPIIPSKESSSHMLATLLPAANIVRLYNTLNSSFSKYQDKLEEPFNFFYEGTNNDAKIKVKTFLDTLSFYAVDLADIKQ